MIRIEDFYDKITKIEDLQKLTIYKNWRFLWQMLP